MCIVLPKLWKMEWRLQIILLFTFLYTSSSETNLTEDVKRNTITNNEGNDKIVNTLNEFGFKILMEMMKEKKDENIVISPTAINGCPKKSVNSFSGIAANFTKTILDLYGRGLDFTVKVTIKRLLAMTLLGSVGKTYDELAEALGFSQDIITNRKHHEQFGNLLKSLNSNDSDSLTLYANAIFVDAHTHLRNLYRSYLTQVYNGETLGVDFKRKVEVNNMINDWVKVHTNGKIDNFLREPVPESTEAMLISALYFRGQWARPFFPELTREWNFQKPSGEIMANFMINYGQFSHIYSTEDQLQMIALPYNDSTTTMYIVKPTFPKRTSLQELMGRINYTKLDKLISNMSMHDCVVRIPKMDLQSDMMLEDALKTLGVQSMFIPNQANFALMVDSHAVNNTEVGLNSRINVLERENKKLREMVNSLPNPGIHVDSVIHKVKMTVNEYGTEAAAVGSSMLARTAVMFYAETPFYMFIRNEKTKLVTFSALIFDPTITT